MRLRYTIRPATPEDAEQIIDHVKAVADEPHNGIASNSADEFTITVEQEREILQDYLDTHNKRYMVAEQDGKIIATINCAPSGSRSGFQHAVSLGITVNKEFRNQGIGTALMQEVINWCKEHPSIKRLELTVFHNNPRAIHIYEKLGFVREGVKRSAFPKHGEWLDMVIMGIVFDKTIKID